MTESIKQTDATCADERYMRRALQLARYGAGHVSPNPMVGAVIVKDGRIIGEGWHRKYGEAHAEVNAVASVGDDALVRGATIYVTLEPCSHYGKTPPCAKLLIDKQLGRVVVGVADPFARVSGRGLKMLREAGIDVSVGVLEDECRALNEKFFTAHELHRPFITLKWAQSADGFIGTFDAEGNPQPAAISDKLGRTLAHAERAAHDAIMVGTRTVEADNPRLDCRLWPGRNPRIVSFNRHGSLPPESFVARNPQSIILDGSRPLRDDVEALYSDYGITSLLVEGGAALLQSFIDAGLFDAVRVEYNDALRLGSGVKAPALPLLREAERIDLRAGHVSRFRPFVKKN